MRKTKRNIARKTKANRITSARCETEPFASAKGHNYHPKPTELHQPARSHSQLGASEAARLSPQGASMDSPGRSEHGERQPGETQPSEARPPQPPAARNTSGAKVTFITNSTSQQTENANTVQTVQTPEATNFSRHLTANQSLSTAKATIEPLCEIVENVQTVQTTGHKEPDSPDSQPALGTPKTEPWSSDQRPGSRSRTNEKPLLKGEQSDATAKSPKGASNDSPGRKAGENQPSEARPPQPPAGKNAPGAKVTFITNSTSQETENANTVQAVQTPEATNFTRHLTANQSLPTAKATIEPLCEIVENVQTVQTTGNKEPDSADSQPALGTPKTEPWSSDQRPGSRSRTNEKHLLKGEQSDATAKSPKGASNDSHGRKAGENQPSEARPPQPTLSQDTPGATVAARIDSLIAKQPTSTNDTNPVSMRLDNATSASSQSKAIPPPWHPASASSVAPREDSPNPRPLTPNRGGDETMRIDAAFLRKYTVLRHENPKDFAQLLREMTAICEPQPKPEELQVLRVAQAHWNLRRIETMQTAFLESTVDRVRCEVPDAHPAAAIAAASIGEDRTDQVWFLDRMQHYRKFHEEHLSRLEGLLFHYKKAREVFAVREARRRSLVTEGNGRTLSQPDRSCILHENLDKAFQAKLIEETQSLTEALARPL